MSARYYRRLRCRKRSEDAVVVFGGDIARPPAHRAPYKQSSLGRTQSGLGLGRILGVPVEISWFTLLILGMIAMNVYSASVRSQRSASLSLVIVLAFVVGYAVSILIHELGHTISWLTVSRSASFVSAWWLGAALRS